MSFFFWHTLYINGLSSFLNNSKIGCHISNVCINHVFYQDDLCLMASCAIALQEFIIICCLYSIEIDINFDATVWFLPPGIINSSYLHSI